MQPRSPSGRGAGGCSGARSREATARSLLCHGVSLGGIQGWVLSWVMCGRGGGLGDVGALGGARGSEGSEEDAHGGDWGYGNALGQVSRGRNSPVMMAERVWLAWGTPLHLSGRKASAASDLSGAQSPSRRATSLLVPLGATGQWGLVQWGCVRAHPLDSTSCISPTFTPPLWEL